jgi:hypothetical protein
VRFWHEAPTQQAPVAPHGTTVTVVVAQAALMQPVVVFRARA